MAPITHLQVTRDRVVSPPERFIKVPDDRLLEYFQGLLGAKKNAQLAALYQLLEGITGHEFTGMRRRLEGNFSYFSKAAAGDKADIKDNDQEARFLRDFCKLMGLSHYRLLGKEVWDAALKEEFLFTLPVTVDWSCLDDCMLRRHWAQHSSKRAALPALADRILIFHRGVDLLGLSSLSNSISMTTSSNAFMQESSCAPYSFKAVGTVASAAMRLRRAANAAIARQQEGAVLDTSIMHDAAVIVERKTLNRAFPNGRAVLRKLLQRVELQEACFTDTVVLYRRKVDTSTGPQDKQILKELDPASMACNIYIKHFKGIPLADLEMVMPEKNIYVPPSVFVQLAAAVVVAVTGLIWTLASADGGPSLGVVGSAVILLFTRASHVYFQAQSERAEIEREMNKLLFERTAASQEAVLHTLAEEMSRQRIRELFICYCVLLLAAIPLSDEELDRRCEQVLRKSFGLRIDFTAEHAIPQLLNWGLVVRQQAPDSNSQHVFIQQKDEHYRAKGEPAIHSYAESTSRLPEGEGRLQRCRKMAGSKTLQKQTAASIVGGETDCDTLHKNGTRRRAHQCQDSADRRQQRLSCPPATHADKMQQGSSTAGAAPDADGGYGATEDGQDYFSGLVAVPLQEALQRLDEVWDGLYDFGPCSGRRESNASQEGLQSKCNSSCVSQPVASQHSSAVQPLGKGREGGLCSRANQPSSTNLDSSAWSLKATLSRQSSSNSVTKKPAGAGQRAQQSPSHCSSTSSSGVMQASAVVGDASTGRSSHSAPHDREDEHQYEAPMCSRLNLGMSSRSPGEVAPAIHQAQPAAEPQYHHLVQQGEEPGAWGVGWEASEGAVLPAEEVVEGVDDVEVMTEPHHGGGFGATPGVGLEQQEGTLACTTTISTTRPAGTTSPISTTAFSPGHSSSQLDTSWSMSPGQLPSQSSSVPHSNKGVCQQGPGRPDTRSTPEHALAHTHLKHAPNTMASATFPVLLQKIPIQDSNMSAAQGAALPFPLQHSLVRYPSIWEGHPLQHDQTASKAATEAAKAGSSIANGTRPALCLNTEVACPTPLQRRSAAPYLDRSQPTAASSTSNRQLANASMTTVEVQHNWEGRPGGILDIDCTQIEHVYARDGVSLEVEIALHLPQRGARPAFSSNSAKCGCRVARLHVDHLMGSALDELPDFPCRSCASTSDADMAANPDWELENAHLFPTFDSLSKSPARGSRGCGSSGHCMFPGEANSHVGKTLNSFVLLRSPLRHQEDCPCVPPSLQRPASAQGSLSRPHCASPSQLQRPMSASGMPPRMHSHAVIGSSPATAKLNRLKAELMVKEYNGRYGADFPTTPR